jgi:hypothetical protein
MVDVGIDVNVSRDVVPTGAGGFDTVLVLGMSGNTPQDQYDEFDAQDALSSTYSETDHPHIHEFGRVLFEMGVDTVAVYNVARSSPSSGDLSTALDGIVNESFRYVVSTHRNGTNPDSDDTAGDRADVSTWAQDNDRIHIATNEISETPTDQETDLANLTDDHTAWVAFENSAQSLDNLDQPVDAASAGALAAEFPGAATLAFQTLMAENGEWPYASDYDAGEVSTIANEGGNAYVPSAGQQIVNDGLSTDNETFIDIPLVQIWIREELEIQLTDLLAEVEKVGYDEDGLALIENEIRDAIQTGVDEGAFDGADVDVTVPDLDNISSTDIANRELNDVTFTARLTGAVHDITVNGTLTV